MRDYEQSRQQFVAGKIGIIASSPNAARAFTDLVGSKFKLGCQIYPRMNKDHGRLPTGGNGGMILTKDPIKQRAAWEYLKFACGPEGQKIAVLGSGYMPTNKLAEKPEYLGDFYKKNPLWYTPIKQIPFAMGWQERIPHLDEAAGHHWPRDARQHHAGRRCETDRFCHGIPLLKIESHNNARFAYVLAETFNSRL